MMSLFRVQRPPSFRLPGGLPCLAALAILLGSAAVAQGDWKLSDMVTQEGGKRIFHARPVDPSLRNPWPAELEAEFQRRADQIIAAQTRDVKAGVNTYFENEKRTYGYLMAHVLGGNEEAALKYLQAQDHQHQDWHRETAGIDYYACFTLKHQMRKYFYFGDLLTPEYKQQMFDGAKKWTEKDPLRRAHYAYDGPKEGWGPDARNSWVDVRSTENLYLMRVSSVYLMAEETGNRETTAQYKQYLLDYTKALYRVGMGEWDSENYHGHSIAPLLNLYDFAQDREVQAAAKACLDFMCAAGAVKYWRGGFNGPTKRDYNHAQPFGGSAANALWVWFGDHPEGKSGEWESDEVHQITSAYRPPLAVVNLARKKFDRPVEIFAAKPHYEATTSYQFDSRPEYLETQYIAHSYQMGSLTGGTSVDGGDVNGFKILAFDKEQGVVALHAAPSSNPALPGSPMYQTGVVAEPNRVAQQENLALWLVKDGKSPWLWVVPAEVKVSSENGVTFLECDRTWVAIRPLGAQPVRVDKALTEQLNSDKKNRFPGYQVLSCRGDGGNFCGLAMEVGERESHGSLPQFKKAVLSAELDVAELEQGVVRYKSADGKWLGIHWNDDPLNLGVWRNGQRRDLQNAALYDSPVIKAGWGEGVLEVHAGEASFRCEVDAAGRASFP
ncbi:hypothetical protein [Lignipirellula cremea]|uniref:Heparinase II/III-like protein n=1 Tax=Lignipirellula cremea TaxID=2528010 RepID=A0A518DKV0_9BACT|nr:hypothetical protein [Lignipirellula cremea]QDU92456.1 hypothetical protein Pla8534_02040 [Lignipirellula cremea]